MGPTGMADLPPGSSFFPAGIMVLDGTLIIIKMKKLIIILFAIAISSCNQKFKKADFLGTWEIVSTTDSETGVVDKLEEEYRFLVDVKLDSLYKDDEVYAWEIIGDSIFVDEWPFYIKEVTGNKVIVEEEYFFGGGKYLIEFIRRNRKYEKFDLMGTWEIVSETDLETGEVYKPEDDDDKFVVDIRFDSLSPYEDEVYAWEIKKDSILVYVDGWPWSFYIKELSENRLLVEDEEWFSGSIILAEFEKRK